MALLKLTLIFVFQFKAGIFGETTLYKITGHDAILPCARASSSNTTCSSVSWLYNRDVSHTFSEILHGNVIKASARAARLDLDTKCSLVITSITAEDAGLYTCRQGRNSNQDVRTHLSVLSISSSPPDADAKRDGEITLECSLLKYIELPPCQQNSIRWVNETGTVLLGEDVGYKFLGQKDCVSVLTVKRQSGHNRRYTCQVVDKNNNVEIGADYTSVFTDWSPLSYIMLTLRIAVLILMIRITVLVFRDRGNTKPLDNENNVNSDAEVQYENVKAHPAATRLQ
ncbi:uncharacterized protein LOC119908725 [Micropterus salmoides]|uniref:uncharacterized protein LOC119908725 n=1 Tax=Micropterus salmoides TaxID=27706 RepID=UPI0018EBCBE3|nr:uncharacterized protein LOC119908725 [Micropterus salmoides]